MRLFTTLLCVTLLTACASTPMEPELQNGLGKIPTTQFSNARTVEEIRALKPQARYPMKIAVMPSDSWHGLSFAEREIIEQWGDKLEQIGFASSLQIIPHSLIPTCGYNSDNNCFLEGARVAGARMRADAILFLNDSTVTDSYVNPLSILDLTIVGMWVVPSHHRDSYSIYEAALFDINNGYLYVVAEGSGENKAVRPYVYTENDTGQQDARIQALNAVGDKLVKLAKEEMKKQGTLAKKDNQITED